MGMTPNALDPAHVLTGFVREVVGDVRRVKRDRPKSHEPRSYRPAAEGRLREPCGGEPCGGRPAAGALRRGALRREAGRGSPAAGGRLREPCGGELGRNGASVRANTALIVNDARVAGQLAVARPR
jgi:hypothetical protein